MPEPTVFISPGDRVLAVIAKNGMPIIFIGYPTMEDATIFTSNIAKAIDGKHQYSLRFFEL